MVLKLCSKCKTEKPLTEFSKNKNNKDGHSYWCRDCRRQMTRDKEQLNPEETNARKRLWDKENADKVKEIKAKSYLNRKEKNLTYQRSTYGTIKRSARQYFFNALRRGEVIKPDRCSSCGSSIKIEAHHTNYNKPLEVVWLCRVCHASLRKKYASNG